LAVEHQRANASGWDDDDGALSVEQWRDAYAWHHSVIEEYEVIDHAPVLA
jgi:hypothetical protein